MTPISLDSPLTVGLLAAVVAVAAYCDIRWRRIPNWLTLGGMAAGLALHTLLGGFYGFRLSATGLVLGFGAYLILYCLHAMGAGDVKLMGTVGALMGPAAWFQVFLATAIAGGLMAAVLCIWKGRLRQTLWNVAFIAAELARFRAPYFRRADLDVKSASALKMPHGVAIATGVLVCLSVAWLR